MSGTHVSSGNKNEADLYHGNGYRKKGYTEIKGSGRKSRYSKKTDITDGLGELISTGIKPFPRVKDRGEGSHAERYYFQHNKNFTHSRVPYKNQAHHLLPQEFWRPLTFEQKQILKKLKYSINNGENIIFLPSDAVGTYIHALPKHNGSHPDYNDAVLEKANKTKKELNDALGDKKPCEDWNPPESILKQLMSLQQEFWDLISKSTKKKINDVAKSEVESGL